MSQRIIIAATALLVWWPLAGVASAAAPDGDRVLVELAITDSLPSEQATALRSLLESQLPAHGLKLRLEPGVTDLRRWLSRDSDEALLRVALDAPPASGWRLVLVDATRGRAIARTLTGGVRRDRAAIEAVFDIVVSAAVALREGLEVASQTVDEALTGTAPTGSPPATPTVAASPSGPVPSPSFALRVHAAAGPAVATFARTVPTSWGVGAAISLWHERAGLELSAARYLSQTVAATEGSFAIDRTQVGLSAAMGSGGRRARFSGSLGVLLEVLHRGDTSPASAGIAATGSDVAPRLGPQATASVGVSLSRRVAVTCAVGLGYFPRRVRYLATVGTDAALVEPWPVTGIGAVRLEVALP